MDGMQAAARPEPASVADIVAEDDDDDVMSEDEAQEAVDHAAARRLPDMPSIATPAPDGEKDEDQASTLSVPHAVHCCVLCLVLLAVAAPLLHSVGENPWPAGCKAPHEHDAGLC